MFEQLRLFLSDHVESVLLREAVMLLVIAVIAVASYYLARAVMLWVEKRVERSETKLDDIVFNKPLCNAIAR
ncbi:MAG: hypothetical protein J6B13_04825, partial [Muribaculaceae bacterium]|nr:hypothetical protein [Muribaculaceae bacterium]